MLSRRELVGRLAAGAAVAVAAGAGTAGVALARGHSPLPSMPEPGNTGSAPAPNGQEVTAAAADAGQAPPEMTAPPAPPPWELLQPLERGAVVAHGWRLTDLTSVVNGACVVTLQNARGRAHRVHLCRNDGRPQGLVFTDSIDLVVMNGGQGEMPTDEGLAQAVAELAHVLAANEVDRRHMPVMTTLVPQRERERQFANAAWQLR